ncbi:hypothetical protein Aph01nite_12820 [Acrocarpospora phusangensis]|uniref:DUF4407 domain-containing protein n=1 Tax=Acrocarpospora phusangensis TaxID=1070424 RepID=A0A919Q621_9ACTN|nr:DUF4407 domain-containing protein [Acrocarpospora phusangensis]GIH22972.1 hypothetical protein Aph01nite_12820 [Acrocarpospora phusangensis]
MRRFLQILSGAHPEVLERCETDRRKFQGIGGAVLTTGVLAAVSMTFALHSMLGVPLAVAVPASLAWGLAILSLDRWLVGSMQAGEPRRWLIAMPRILMAVLLGFAISTPLVLQIFKPEIDAQTSQIKQRHADEFAARQQAGASGADIEKLRAEVTSLEKVVSSGGDDPLDPARDPRISALTAERDAEQVQADKSYKEWRCQLYGGEGCPKKGNGPLAQGSEAAYTKSKDRVDELNRQIEKRKKQLSDASSGAKATRLAIAKQALPQARDRLSTAVDQQRRLQDAFAEENLRSSGLLLRLQALDEVADRDVTLRVAHVLLMLLFLLIECLPVAVKLMQRPGNYERLYPLVMDHEFRQARTDLVTPGQTGDGTTGIQRIWARQERPARVTPVPVAVPAQAPAAGTMPYPPGDPEGSYGTLADDALRDMPDGQTTTWVARPEDPADGRVGEFELLADEN